MHDIWGNSWISLLSIIIDSSEGVSVNDKKWNSSLATELDEWSTRKKEDRTEYKRIM